MIKNTRNDSIQKPMAYLAIASLVLSFLTLTGCKKKSLSGGPNGQGESQSLNHASDHSSAGGTSPELVGLVAKSNEESAPQNVALPTGSTINPEREIAHLNSNTGDHVTTPNAATTTPEKPELVPNCFTLAFVHKNQNHSEESCSQHRNLFKLKHTNYQKNTLCVRVDGKPVRYKIDKKNLDEVIIGPVAGPQSKVTLHYCLNNVPKCHQSCKIPKDEFLSAIGGEDDEDGLEDKAGRRIANYGQWDETNPNEKPVDVTAKLDSTLRKELKDVEEFSNSYSLYKDWEMNTETPSCVGRSDSHVERPAVNISSKTERKG